MSRSTKVLSLVLFAALATPVIAGPPAHPGYQFGAATAAGCVDAQVKISGPNFTIKTNPGLTVATVAAEPARDVASATAAALCTAADATALTCTSDATFPLALGGPCGFSTAGGAGALQQIANCVDGGGNGFSITLTPAGNINFYLSLKGTAQFRSADGFECTRGCGDAGMLSGDLLTSVQMRLIPTTNGVVTFNTPGIPPGPNNPFTIDTSTFPGASTPGSAADFNLHKAVCDKYALLGINATTKAPNDPQLAWIDTTNTAGGYSVELTQTGQATSFDVTPVAGQRTVIQVTGADTVTAAVPALSEWGMILLVGILLIAGIWMMRRRQKLQPSS